MCFDKCEHISTTFHRFFHTFWGVFGSCWAREEPWEGLLLSFGARSRKSNKNNVPQSRPVRLPPLRVTLQDPFWSPKMEQIMENTNPKCLWVTFWEFLENASVRTTFLMDFYGFFNMWKRKKCVKPSEGRSNLRGSFFWAKKVSTSISDCVSVSWGFTLASF